MESMFSFLSNVQLWPPAPPCTEQSRLAPSSGWAHTAPASAKGSGRKNSLLATPPPLRQMEYGGEWGKPRRTRAQQGMILFKLANITDSSDRKAGTEQWSVLC